MRLMGTGKLHALAVSGDGAAARAAAMLRFELASFNWNGPEEVVDDYPTARIVGHRIQIDLPEENCVVLGVNYCAGIVLVEFAGPRSARSNPFKSMKRKLT